MASVEGGSTGERAGVPRSGASSLSAEQSLE